MREVGRLFVRVRVNACMCLYDEQSQICMDTVIGILSVFSCSLTRERGLDGLAVRWMDLWLVF